MPLKFWKKEKGEEKPKEPEGRKPEGKPQAKAPKPPAEEKPSVAEARASASTPPAVPAAAPAAPARPAPERAAAPPGTIDDAHAALVSLGLTIPATKAIFGKRVDAFPGGRDAFLKLYASEPYKAVTQVLAAWLGIRTQADFDPEAFLADVNPRLSSFGMTIEVKDLAWLDQELGLRKCKLRLGDHEKVVRFKDPRDFLKGVNDLVSTKKVSFIELETWADELAFLLVRDPKWDALASTELVVVKDPQTAADGECGECGAKVGKYWNDCLSCGAVFG
jgi:hypothetical protein